MPEKGKKYQLASRGRDAVHQKGGYTLRLCRDSTTRQACRKKRAYLFLTAAVPGGNIVYFISERRDPLCTTIGERG